MVSNMEKHYVFKSLFEDNITQVSSIGGKASRTLKCMCHSAHIFRCSYCSRATRRLLIDNGCNSPELCNPIQHCLACRNLYILPDVKMSSKNTLRHSNGIIVFKKTFPTPKARCSCDQRCLMTEVCKPLYPALCVSLRHLQRCRHGAKFKSSNCFCFILYHKEKLCYPFWRSTEFAHARYDDQMHPAVHRKTPLPLISHLLTYLLTYLLTPWSRVLLEKLTSEFCS
jgi:hypothetical protein